MVLCITIKLRLVFSKQVSFITSASTFVLNSGVKDILQRSHIHILFTKRIADRNSSIQFLSTSSSIVKVSRMISSFSNARSVAVCQFTAKNNKEDNFNVCKGFIENACTAGAKMIFLPEACDYMAENKDEALDLSEPLDGDLVTKYKELAKTLKVWLSLGGIHEKVDDRKVQNTHVVINDDGVIVAVYRKLHLFDVEIPEKNVRLKESDYVKRGEEIVKPIPSPVGLVGLGICYDVRFPEMSLVLRKLGAEILTYPSAFTFATGAIHWEVLLRSRAIENQCYVIAAAQTGMHNKKRQSWGHAMIIDPLGNIIAQCSEGSNFALANISIDLIENTRKSMPVKDHRRTDVYPDMFPISKHDHGRKDYDGDSLLSSDHSNKMATSNNDQLSYQFGHLIIPDSTVFYKSNLSMAFVNKRCIVPGHVLVAPFRPAPRLTDLSPDEVSDLFNSVQKVEMVMERVHGASSTTIAVQDGPDAGRTIKHLHVHVLPRKKGDFLQNDQIYYELQQHDKNEDRPWRCEQEMNTEAADLKKFFT